MAVNVLTEALVSSFFFLVLGFFCFLKGFVPSSIIPLHHGTAMKPAWYACLKKIIGFHGNCFYFNNSLCHLGHEKRRRRSWAQIRSQQQSITGKASQPSKPSIMKICPPKRAETFPKPFYYLSSYHQCNCRPVRHAASLHSLHSPFEAWEKAHNISGVVLKDF